MGKSASNADNRNKLEEIAKGMLPVPRPPKRLAMMVFAGIAEKPANQQDDD